MSQKLKKGNSIMMWYHTKTGQTSKNRTYRSSWFYTEQQKKNRYHWNDDDQILATTRRKKGVSSATHLQETYAVKTVRYPSNVRLSRPFWVMTLQQRVMFWLSVGTRTVDLCYKSRKCISMILKSLHHISNLHSLTLILVVTMFIVAFQVYHAKPAL